MSGTFFVDWALWQQMSFGLACAMAVVMVSGVCRLQYLNLKSKRIMLEDEEKNARLSGVRSTGLRVRRDNDIPFGIRAIESGIEVDGIWISRPTTPVNPASVSVSTLITDEHQGKDKDKEKDVEGYDLPDTGSTAASPHLSPNDYRPRQPSTLRNSASGDSDVLGSIDTYAATLEQEQYGTGHHSSQYSRPNRDYSPSTGSSSRNCRTPDPFGDSSKFHLRFPGRIQRWRVGSTKDVCSRPAGPNVVI